MKLAEWLKLPEIRAIKNLDLFGNLDFISGVIKQNLKVIEVPARYRARTCRQINISRFRYGCLLLKMSRVAFKKIRRLGQGGLS